MTDKANPFLTITSLTPADRVELQKAAKEAAASYLRIDSENDLIKEIAKNVKLDFEISTGDFKKIAKWYHEQDKEESEAKFEAKIELYELIFPPVADNDSTDGS